MNTIIGTEGRIENYDDVSKEDNCARIHLWNASTGKYRRDGDEVFDIPHQNTTPAAPSIGMFSIGLFAGLRKLAK